MAQYMMHAMNGRRFRMVMKTHGLKRRLADVDSRIADLDRCAAETRSELESSPNGLSEEALKVYESIKHEYLAERAEIVSKIGRKSRL
jgi:phage gp37-like protein